MFKKLFYFIIKLFMLTTGAEVLLNTPSLSQSLLKGKRAAYLGHSAAVDKKGRLVLSCLRKQKHIHLTAIFSPQHGFGSTKQANMITSPDSFYKGLKLYSLYSQKTRRLTDEMKADFDVLLFDLQDVGCRVYTYLTSLFYLIEDCAQAGKKLVILDRPNPLGRYVEGSRLKPGFESFVGAGPLPMSHGLTLGEAGLWFKAVKKLKTDLHVVKMKGWNPKNPWPNKRPWILPSPNMTGLACALCYPGGVLLEGTLFSEGRGTSKPFEIFGRPGLDTQKILSFMRERGPSSLSGCLLREMLFEPAFDKFSGKTCSGFQIHLEKAFAKKGPFRPYRLISLFLKAFRATHPLSPWQAPPPYEYERKKAPIDIISASDDLRAWLENPKAGVSEWEDFLTTEERLWKKQRKDFLLYK